MPQEQLCKVCRRPTSSFDIIDLSNGGAVHTSCYDEVKKQYIDLMDLLSQKKHKIETNRIELLSREGLVSTILSYFFSSIRPDSILVSETENLKTDIAHISAKLSYLREKCADTFDYLLDYPPDWEERKHDVGNRDGFICSKCGRNDHLHLHHISQLSKGGSNKIENLTLCCESCHSAIHGGRISPGNFNEEPQKRAINSKIELINKSIQENKTIKFNYLNFKKGHDTNYVRPSTIFSDNHAKLKAFCILCKFEKEFSIDRMSKIELVDKPPFMVPAEYIEEAMRRGMMIHCHYTKSGGGKSMRTLNPIGYTEFKGVKVLKCYDFMTKEERMFSPQRMKNLELVSGPKEQKVISGKP